METVEVVIRIQKDLYETLKANIVGTLPKDSRLASIFTALINLGTVLPKGHGRLIDADMVVSDIDTERVNLFMDGLKGTPRGYQHLNDLERIMDEIPTVIEADKEKE